MKETAIVIGASSGLGRALCEYLGGRGYDLILSARTTRDLSAIGGDLEIKYGIKAHVLPIDLSQLNQDSVAAFVDHCFEKAISLNQVYITAAMINNDDQDEKSINLLREIFEINFFGTSFLFGAFAKKLSGTDSSITVISSIAAIRPRSANIAYASSKIAMEYLIKGLRHYYSNTKLNIQIYRVGYMDTGMIQGKKLLLPAASTSQVAKYIYEHRNVKFEIRYYPGYWKYIAIVLSLFPWFIYKKLRF